MIQTFDAFMSFHGDYNRNAIRNKLVYKMENKCCHDMNIKLTCFKIKKEILHDFLVQMKERAFLFLTVVEITKRFYYFITRCSHIKWKKKK